MTDTVYLKPISSFLGDPPRSDTLFGAICWGVKLTKGEDVLEELLSGFTEGNPPFLLSSSFPTIGGDSKRHHFFPMPLSEPVDANPQYLEDFNRLKAVEEIEYVEDELFEQILSGELDREAIYLSDSYQISSGYLYEEGEFNSEMFPVFDKRNVQRTTINRLTNGTHEGRLFHSEETRAKRRNELFFLLDGEESILDTIRTSLRFLQDRGLGGDVSVGKGDFELTIVRDNSPIEEPAAGKYFTNLSLFYPGKEENSRLTEERKNSWFTTLRRRGRLESSFVDTGDVWKDAVLVYGEGSVFPDILEGPYGRNPVVKREPFDVQYYGYSYPIGLKKENK